MELYNLILENTMFKELVSEIEKEEKSRKFCKHNIEHFLNVARIAYIENLEHNLNIGKDVIYATALLHDIGRAESLSEYDNHNEASAQAAYEILSQCNCEENTKNSITDAIFNHGNQYISGENNLCGIIYRADKASRNCYVCLANDECNWKEEKKNYRIER